MDIPVHDEIVWRACNLARDRLAADGTPAIADPLSRFPVLSRGSWINDTNQVTVFSDALKGTNARVSDKMQLFFQELWKLDLGELVAEMGKQDPVLAASASAHSAGATDVRDFGTYLRFDHLDILRDEPANEYGALGADPRAQTVRSTLRFVEERLYDSTVGKDPALRLNERSLTSLGRALHTLGDFFAHTNFVELLLWELALRNALDPSFVQGFNRAPAAFASDGDREFTFALPRKPAETPPNAVLWYGESPAVTPLVSSVFDSRDTACSLLAIYAAQLEREGPAPTEDEMNIALAVFDVPGRTLVEAAWKLYRGAQELLEGIGRAARAWLADQLDAIAARSGAAEPAVANAAALVRHYDSAEAMDWARAGRLRYVVRAIARDIGTGLRGQTPRTPLLPHHTLLSKDHSPETAEDRLRFSLACLLATEVCARVVAWHFSEKPAAAGFAEIRDRWLIHPTLLLDARGTVLDAKKAAAAAAACYGLPWRRLSEAAPTLLG